MTVSAHKLKMILVGLPILKAAAPGVLFVLGTNLLGWVNVVYGENTHILYPTDRTRPSKRLNEPEFASPVPSGFSLSIFSVPVRCSAFVGTKDGVRGLPALSTGSLSFPAVVPVALDGAELGVPFTHKVLDRTKSLATPKTPLDGCSFLHAFIITQYVGNVNKTYYAIALARIQEELRLREGRGPLFKCGKLLDGGAR